LGWVRVIWLCLKIVFEIAVAEGHESGERLRPHAVDSPIQVISSRNDSVGLLLCLHVQYYRIFRRADKKIGTLGL
jgi:hypothetical protein